MEAQGDLKIHVQYTLYVWKSFLLLLKLPDFILVIVLSFVLHLVGMIAGSMPYYTFLTFW